MTKKVFSHLMINSQDQKAAGDDDDDVSDAENTVRVVEILSMYSHYHKINIKIYSTDLFPPG